MPLYEYLCGSCGHRFERIQKFSDPPVSTCPSCGAQQVEKLMSSPAIQFKGSGWYITDYAKSGGKKPADESPKDAKAPTGDGAASASAGSKDSTPASSSSSDAASTTKPAAKPDPKAR
jgi:putative FmdB family regulatory protein